MVPGNKETLNGSQRRGKAAALSWHVWQGEWMMGWYAFLADALVAFHVGYVAYVVVGQLLILLGLVCRSVGAQLLVPHHSPGCHRDCCPRGGGWLDLSANYAGIHAPRVGGPVAVGGVVHGALIPVGDCSRLAALGVRRHEYWIRRLGPSDVRARPAALAAVLAPSGANRPIRIGQPVVTVPAGITPDASGEVSGPQEEAPSRVPVGRRTRPEAPVRRGRPA
jgi:hypothetical protein